MKYGLDMRIRDVKEDEEAVAAVNRFLSGVLAMTEGRPEVDGMSLRSLGRYLGDRVPAEALTELEAVLRTLGEKRHGISPAEEKRIEMYREMEAKRAAGAGAASSKEGRAFKPALEGDRTAEPASKENRFPYTAVRPGQVWLDTEGKRIQAHAGGIIFENDTYYWYGENKEYTDGKSPVWTWGIRLYSSKDFYNWTDCGLIIPPVVDDPSSPLFPESKVDRPHIVKNEKTGRYVCWIKLSGPEACFTVLTAESLQGPYEIVRDFYNPLDLHIGDFDIAVDEKSGKAYLYCEAEHDRVVGMLLSDDYLQAEKLVSTQYSGLQPPFCREGVTVFERGGRLFMLTSGMSGYVPNQSDAAEADGYESGFASVGDPHVGDDSLSSFNSQIGQVFHVPGTDTYIALADRWVPGYEMTHDRSLAIRQAIASTHDPEKYPAAKEQMEELMAAPMLESACTRDADYVFLPIECSADGKPRIPWKESWTL